ncbi:MAG: hypothetical protein D6800_14340 [Candidatus Zixiibacteriota bacterium]|nr:MAG: hypothetical protein D6800_14340 [candidate division Zixibacteria bacterium]
MARRKKRAATEGPEFLESWLFKISTKVFLGVLVIVLFLTLVRCTVRKPEAPQWTTQLTVPLINRTYPMDELVQRIGQSEVQIQGNQVVFSVNEEFDTVGFSNGQLTTPDLSYGLSQTLGSVTIDPPTIPAVTVDASNIGPLSTVIPGAVPPLSFQVVNDLPTITTFTDATVDTGTIYLVITNNLGVDLDIVNVLLTNQVAGDTVGTGSAAGGIASGNTALIPIPLFGRTLTNQLRATIDAHTNGGTVLSSSGKNLTTNVQFSGPLTVVSATAQVPPTSRSFSQVIALNETDPVYQATLADGELALTITNTSGLDADLQLTFPDLTKNGQPLVIQQTVTAKNTSYQTVNVTGYDLRPSDSTVPQQLWVQAEAVMPGSGANQVLVRATDKSTVNATLRRLSFASITGVFNNSSLSIPPTVQPVTVPNGFDSVQLVNAILTLEIENAVNLPGSLSVTVQGNNGKTLNFSGPVQPGSSGLPTITTFIDSAAADFLSPIPTSVTVSGSAGFGDGISPGTVTANDYVLARVNILSPLELVLGRTSVQTDVNRNQIDQSNIDIVTNHTEQARFVYNIINHLPIGAHVNLFFGPDSATLFTAPQLEIDSLVVPAAPTSLGIASDTASSGFQTILLTNDDIRILENDTLYSSVELVLEGTGGQVIRLTGDDYVTVQGRLEVDYHFDGNL